jgi:hypothetical protein
MKKRVLTYTANDAIIGRQMILEPIAGSNKAFTSEYEGDYFWLVLEVSPNVYITEGTYRKETLAANCNQLDQIAENWLSGILDLKWISLLRIAAAKEAGMDIAPMEARRAEIKAQREQEAKEQEEKKKAERAQKAKEAEEREAQIVAAALDKFKAGEMVPVGSFISILKAQKVAVHPRSLGMLYKLSDSSKIGQTRASLGMPGKKVPRATFDSVFEIAAKITA